MQSRLLKAICGDCAYTVRVTRKWLADAGPPLCPCNKRPMECAQWEELIESEMESWTEAQDETTRTLRDKWVTLRSIQQCISCNGEMWHGESARHRTYTVGGELLSEYTCLRCNERTRARMRA